LRQRQQLLRACINASWPAAPRSSSSKSNPADVPSPRIGGALTGMMVASWYAAK